jgi:HK97 family phage portal protein
MVKIGALTFPEYRNVPRWVDEPDPSDPTITADRYIYTLVASLVGEGNYFVHAYPNILAPEALTALDPRRVRTPDGTTDFEVLDDKGQVVAVLSPMEVLHGVMYPYASQRRGPAPLDLMARTIGSSIAADDFAARFFGQGAALSFGVEVPSQLTDEQKKSLRESLKARYQGNRNSHAIGVLTAGAKFVGGLAPTPEQAQMLETRKFYLEEFARFLGVPPYMLGSQEPGAASYASTQTADKTFAERTVLPLVQRIESQHTRLLSELVPVPGGKAQFRLNMDAILRPNMLARYQAYETGIRSGVLKPNEARDKENLAPVPGGERVYMQAQMTPIEMLGVQPEEPADKEDPEDAQDAEDTPARGVEVHTHITADMLRVEPPILPPQPAPVVTIEAPAPVLVPAPVVNVAAPDFGVVLDEIAQLRKEARAEVRKTVTRDKSGRITEIVETRATVPQEETE